jgi:hypothetical protein
VNIQLNNLKEITNKQMNEIKNTIQDMKQDINKGMETLKKIKLNNSISQTKISIKSLAKRIE